MGVITTCCTRESIIHNSQISLYSKSEDDFMNNENKIMEISLNKEIDNPFEFITSGKYYSLILQKKNKNEISYQITKDKKIQEIILLMYDLLKWIKDINNNNKKIILIKNITRFGFEYLLKEMKEKNYEDKNNYFINKSLTNMCLIIQSILFLQSKENNENNENDFFKVNIWTNKDIINENKKYAYQGCFFLMLYKNKKNNINFDETDKNKIKDELKKEINQYYKLSINFCNDLINF